MAQDHGATMTITMTETVRETEKPQPVTDGPKGFSSSSKVNQGYKYRCTDDVDHFLTKGWLLIPNAIKEDYRTSG